MKTSTHRSMANKTGTRSHIILVVLLTSTLLAPHAWAADADDGFQYNALFSPSPAQLKAEDHGRVMIYDGLDNAVVERALDEQFDRIEHMMFVRTRQNTSDEDNVYIVEDDGC